MKNKLKIFVSIFLVVITVMSFSACNENPEDNLDNIKDSENVSDNVENIKDFVEGSGNENSKVNVGKYKVPAESDFTWEGTDGGVILTSYMGDETAVEIPATLGGEKVVKIGEKAFQQIAILGIRVPDTVTLIDNQAFLYCMNLVEVDLGNGVIEIGDSVFEGCSALTRVELSSNLEKIGELAFGWNSSLTKIELPESLQTISKGAFCMSGLEKITLPSSLKTISEETFQSCKSLKTVKISDGTTVIERRAFDACEALEKIEIPGTVETFEGHPLNRCDGVTIYAPAGSAAEDYANLYDINFKVA
ncbi:MAG: leucine-rich repeat domain-containing protein [Clostridia bacterium]|nr:leucine-rich repeat domain-containing protein [Clostridia bacterium]